MKQTPLQLLEENKRLKETLALRDHTIAVKEREIGELERLVAFFKATKYGPKSEALHSNQRELFNEAEENATAEPEADISEADGESESRSSPERTRAKRKPIPPSFPRVERIIDLPEEKKVCPHLGIPLRRVGEEISERLDIIPAVIQVIRTIRPRYACSCGSEGCDFHIALPEPQPIPKSNASSGLLAYIATSKYADHCPLHRQEEMLGRLGIDIPRNTLANWMIRCGQLVTPLINLIRDELLTAPLVYCDETPLQVHKGTKKSPRSKCYMWVQASWGGVGERFILYNFDPTRKAAVALELFKDYKGYVQTDGYEGYSVLEEVPGITLVGDWVHVRRKFHDVTKAGETSEKAKLATYALGRIAEIYTLETEGKSLGDDDKLRLRQDKVKPIVMALKAWADAQRDSVPPKSLIGKAIAYFLSQWPKLCYFLEDVRVGPDTNRVENSIRPFALGRKNWMFSDTVRGAEASANLYSLIITARVNDIDPYDYLKTIFERLPAAETIDDFAQLLPRNFVRPSSSQA